MNYYKNKDQLLNYKKNMIKRFSRLNYGYNRSINCPPNKYYMNECFEDNNSETENNANTETENNANDETENNANETSEGNSLLSNEYNFIALDNESNTNDMQPTLYRKVS